MMILLFYMMIVSGLSDNAKKKGAEAP